jgi:hypothetical protein
MEHHLMNRGAAAIVVLGATLTLSGVTTTAELPQPQVVGQELTGISAPGVTGVLWTRRQDHFTLQVQLTRPPNNLAAKPTPVSPTGIAYPDIRVQLRDSKGTEIPHLRRLAVAPSLQAQAVARGAADSAGRIEVIYTFHLGDGERADTVAIQINERSFVEQIPRLAAPG